MIEIVNENQLLEEFRKEAIIVVGPLTILQSGKASPIYVDLRWKLYERPDLLWSLGKLIVEKIIEVSDPNKKQKIIAVPDAANPMAVAASLYAKIACKMDMPIIVLRKEPKTYGTQRDSLLIGKIEPNTEYNLIDDVITSSASKEKAIEQLFEERIKIARIIVVVDRQQGGAELLKQKGYDLFSLYKILDIADQFLENGHTTEQKHKEIVEFIKNNKFI